MTMKVKRLNGKIDNIETKPSSYPIRSEDSCRSKIQYDVGQALVQRFPYDTILEDVPTPDGFYLDFFIPKRKLAYEIQGEQHDKFVPFFHKTEANFRASQRRDNDKLEFCRINDISLIRIKNVQELKEIWQQR